jgi:hypothetical protein
MPLADHPVEAQNDCKRSLQPLMWARGLIGHACCGGGDILVLLLGGVRIVAAVEAIAHVTLRAAL